MPSKEVARDRILDDEELAEVILAARKIGGPYGGVLDVALLVPDQPADVKSSLCRMPVRRRV
jgi:hypothetical protein